MAFSWFDFLKPLKQDKDKDRLIEELSEEVSYWQNQYKQEKRLRETPEWMNPHGWLSYTDKDYNSLGDYDIQPNGFIIINDKDLKRQALMLKGSDVKETADNIEKFLNKYITYTSDFKNMVFNGQLDIFIPANITFNLRQGDCDDYAILFQSMMHICGFSKECVVCIAKNVNHLVKWYDGQELGHSWNKVLIDGKWVDFDANSGSDLKKKCVYPEIKNLSYFFNYWSIFKSS